MTLSNPIIIPEKFQVAMYRFTLEALDTLHLLPYKGSALRGGFGHTFKRLVCVQRRACVQRCELGNGCPYGYIFETSPPEDAEVLRTFQDVPRPFIIEPDADKRLLLIPGERLTFGLTLIGQALNYLPYFLAVFRELGAAGLGRRRGKFRLARLVTHTPYGDATEVVYEAETGIVQTIEAALDSRAISTQAARLPVERLTLDFVTPTQVKHGGRFLRDDLPFAVLVKTLLGRVSSLSYFHCGQPFEVDFRGLIDRAAGVEPVARHLYWEDWSRFSGRQKQRIRMGGLMGRVTYEGHLAPYLPLLALGELIHAGKGTVFGNGQYRIEREG